MIATHGQTVWLGWAYVVFRTLYRFLAFNNGIGRVGAKDNILFSTGPMYVILLCLLVTTVKNII